MIHGNEQAKEETQDLFHVDRPVVTPEEEKALREDIRAIIRESGLREAVQRSRRESQKTAAEEQRK